MSLNKQMIWPLFVVALAFPSTPASAAYGAPAYEMLYVNLGTIKGEVTQKGREGSFVAMRFSYGAGLTGADPSAGKPVSGLFHVTRAVGTASGPIWQAMMTGVKFPTVTLTLWAPSTGPGGVGIEVITQVVRLFDAVIVSVDQYSEPQASGNYVLVEDVALSYGRIEITNPLVPGKACYDLRLGAACQ